MGNISAPVRLALNKSVHLVPKVSVQSYSKVKRVHGMEPRVRLLGTIRYNSYEGRRYDFGTLLSIMQL